MSFKSTEDTSWKKKEYSEAASIVASPLPKPEFLISGPTNVYFGCQGSESSGTNSRTFSSEDIDLETNLSAFSLPSESETSPKATYEPGALPTVVWERKEFQNLNRTFPVGQPLNVTVEVDRIYLRFWIQWFAPSRSSEFPYNQNKRPNWWPRNNSARYLSPNNLRWSECVWVAVYILGRAIANPDPKELAMLKELSEQIEIENELPENQMKRVEYMSQLFHHATLHQQHMAGQPVEEDRVMFSFDKTPPTVEILERVQHRRMQSQDAQENSTDECQAPKARREEDVYQSGTVNREGTRSNSTNYNGKSQNHEGSRYKFVFVNDKEAQLASFKRRLPEEKIKRVRKLRRRDKGRGYQIFDDYIFNYGYAQSCTLEQSTSWNPSVFMDQPYIFDQQSWLQRTDGSVEQYQTPVPSQHLNPIVPGNRINDPSIDSIFDQHLYLDQRLDQFFYPYPVHHQHQHFGQPSMLDPIPIHGQNPLLGPIPHFGQPLVLKSSQPFDQPLPYSQLPGTHQPFSPSISENPFGSLHHPTWSNEQYSHCNLSFE